MLTKGFGRGRRRPIARFDKRPPAAVRKAVGAKKALFAFSIILIILTIAIIEMDKRAFPQIFEVAHMKSKNKINTIINLSVTEISKNMELKAEDFYYKSFDESGKVCDIAVNTILVNEFCALLAERLSDRLIHMGNEEVNLPTGSLTGIRYFANFGPEYTVILTPMGDAYVDYDCSFESVGINQVNFQIWLIVDSIVKVVNPLQSQDIELSRKVALVNTVITGEVPDTYLNATGFNEQK